MRIFILNTVTLLLVFTLSTNAQNVKKIKKLIDKGHFEQALAISEKTLQIQPENEELNYYAGLSKLKLYQQEEALTYLLKSTSKVDKLYHFNLTVAYFENDQYEKAKETARLVDKSILNEQQLNLIENQMKSYADLVQKPKEIFIKNMGEKINTNAHEYSGVMTFDQRSVVYTTRKSSTNDLAADGMAYEEIYRTTLDSSDNWQMPVKFAKHSSKNQHDATVAMFDNDTKMITYHDEDLFVSELKNGEWSKPAPINEINDSNSAETHCFITDNYDTIYYATNYYSENDDLDLYMITKVNEDEWSEPEPLTELNSEYHDDSPYLAKNGDFYFSSKGHNSMGGYDIFKSSFNAKTGKWNKPENLGYNINSASDDTYFNMFGKVGYLSSGRKGGYGNMDIYTVLLFNKINIQGQVIDKNTSTAISGAEVTITGKEQRSTVTDERGFYSIVIPIEELFEMNISYQNKIIYNAAHFAKVHFRDYNDNIVHFKVDMTTDIDAQKTQEATEVSVIMVNDFDTDPLTLVPSKGDQSLLTMEVYSKKEAPIAAIKKLEIKNTPIKVIDNPILKRAELPTVYFAFDSDVLESTYKMNLDELAIYLKEMGSEVVIITGHTDQMGTSEYNDGLSKERALVVKEYLSQKGVPENALKIKFKGETTPKENTKNKNRKNRRVEIRYLQNNQVVSK